MDVKLDKQSRFDEMVARLWFAGRKSTKINVTQLGIAKLIIVRRGDVG